jgi:hypothetical protein
MYWIEGVDSTREGLWVEVSRLDVLIPIVQPEAVAVKKKYIYIVFQTHGRTWPWQKPL